jgi:hypothetical protein
MAYVTRAMIEEAADLTYTMWQPALSSSGALDTWVDGIVSRVAGEVAYSVGATHYATSDTPTQAVLTQAELCLALYYVGLSAALVGETSDDSDQQPQTGHGVKILALAQEYRKQAERLLSGMAKKKQKGRKPTATSTEPTAEYIPNFETDVSFEVP